MNESWYHFPVKMVLGSFVFSFICGWLSYETNLFFPMNIYKITHIFIKLQVVFAELFYHPMLSHMVPQQRAGYHLVINTSVSRNKAHAHSKANFDRINRAAKIWLYCIKLVLLDLYRNIIFNDANFILTFFIYLK
jgi:hypothetical protein